MNKNCNLFISLILLLASMICSCRKEPGGELKYFNLTRSDTILDRYNAERPNWDWAVETDGTVKITVNDSLILIELSPDSSYQHITYFLQTGKKESGLKGGSFGRAEVLFLDRNIIVNSLESEKTLQFSIKGESDPPYLKVLKDVKKYIGFGLGLRRTNIGGIPASVPSCKCVAAGNAAGNCNSGGDNALSCGTANKDGSCKVGCSGQMVACCDYKKIEVDSIY